MLHFFEKLSSLVSLRLAEMVNEAVKENRYQLDYRLETISGEPVDWHSKLFTSFDKLVAQETESKEASASVRPFSKTFTPLVKFLKITRDRGYKRASISE